MKSLYSKILFNINELPPNVQSAISGEQVEFIVKSPYLVPRKKAVKGILFGLFLLAFMSIFVIAFLGPVIMGTEVHFTSNGTPITAGPNNLLPLLAPGLIISFFVLIGLGILVYSLILLFRKGNWFVGTKQRLIEIGSKKLQSIDWEQFSGNIKVEGTKRKATLIFGLRTGKTVRQEIGQKRYDEFVPDKITIAEIPNAFEIEKICRQQISKAKM